ncbi:uncharacterized protein LOC143453041 [Clavelina lepadiformis]|uniref:uncharacterized protein LOC143453041 n=1 Tax=Clavelina lepadiformis TaxID=159417 RepID=UPI004041A28B
MKVNMGELSASTSNVIGSVSRDLEPGVLMALPKKQSLKRTLQRKRRELQTAHCTAALQSPMDTNTVNSLQADPLRTVAQAEHKWWDLRTAARKWNNESNELFGASNEVTNRKDTYSRILQMIGEQHRSPITGELCFCLDMLNVFYNVALRLKSSPRLISVIISALRKRELLGYGKPELRTLTGRRK